MSYRIEHVSIRCRDMEASIEYFKRMFDAEVILRRKPGEGRRIVFLRLGSRMIELMEMGPASDPAEPFDHYGFHHIGIEAEDFESAYRDLKAKGANFLREPFEPTPGIRLAFLQEPNGTVIELVHRNSKVFEKALAEGDVNW